jgi:hypothetical protein
MDDRSEILRKYTIGRARFRKISAVEGLSMSFSAGREFESDDVQRLTPDERRRRIIQKYTSS